MSWSDSQMALKQRLEQWLESEEGKPEQKYVL